MNTLEHFGGQACQSCKIYVLDLQTVAAEEHVPACNISDPLVWPFNQPGYAFEGSDQLEHYDCQSAGSYYLDKQLRQSCHRSTDIEEADLVFISGHCYIMWWYACIHHRQCHDQQGQYYLDRLLRAVVSSERFQRTGGRDFLFYRPSVSDIMFEGLWQQTIDSIHVVHERGQIGSANWDKNRHIIAPYSSTNDQPPFQSKSQRTTRVFFRGGCADEEGSPGKLLRYRLVEVFDIMNLEETDVVCSCAQCPGHASHAELMVALQQSVFCLLPGGDTQSSRRLTEIIMAGCIPVIIGPPYHTLPFAQDVDYKSFAVFFNVTNLETLKLYWPNQLLEGYMLPERLDLQSKVINIQTLDEIAVALIDRARFSDEDIVSRQTALLLYKSRFLFKREGDEFEPDAVATIIDNACRAARSDRAI